MRCSGSRPWSAFRRLSVWLKLYFIRSVWLKLYFIRTVCNSPSLFLLPPSSPHRRRRYAPVFDDDDDVRAGLNSPRALLGSRHEVERRRRRRGRVVAASLHLVPDLVLPAAHVARSPPPSYDNRAGLNSPAQSKSPETRRRGGGDGADVSSLRPSTLFPTSDCPRELIPEPRGHLCPRRRPSASPGVLEPAQR